MVTELESIQTLEKILAEHGPLSEDDITIHLRQAGVPDPELVLRLLRREIDCPAGQLNDERWVWLPTVLAGRVFTHRLGALEAAHDILTANPDLNPITVLCEHEQYARFSDGSPAQVVMIDFDDDVLEERGIPEEAVEEGGALLLAPGTLRSLGVTKGDLVGVRLTADGLAVERITPPSAADANATSLGARLTAMADTDEPIFFAAAVWAACVEDPALLTEPLPPLSDIADQSGLTRDRDSLAHGEFDFPAWRLEARCKLMAERHGIEFDDAVVLYALVEMYERTSLLVDAAEDDVPDEDVLPPPDAGATPSADDTSTDLAGELGAALADPLLAELLVAETVDVDPDGAAALGLFAAVLEARVPRAARAPVRWLRAVALQRLGDVEAAERELLAAESMDTSWPLTLVDLARIASDRGDAERGLSLLRRAGAEPDDPLVALLERHRAQPRRDIGRNEACWCGSGRKYKKCHLGREESPLAERVNWLYAKAAQHVMMSGWNDLLAEVGYERCRYADPDDEDALAEALADPLVLDAVLFEGGAFEEFLRARGALLPDDERLLAEQWLLVERSIFEVEQVRRGHGMTVRDLRTGDTHEVHERAASSVLQAGQLICARVVPAGDTMMFFGGIEPVALHQRDELIDLLDGEPDAVTLVAQLTRRFAPPTLVNTEGDPLTMCEASVQVGTAPGIIGALDEIYDRVDADADQPRWNEHVMVDGLQRVRATLALDGDTLRVQANSEPRMDRVLATLAQLDPAVTVLDDIRHPVRDAREAAEVAARMPVSGQSPLDPADPQAALLDEVIRGHEARWLDEPIPALAGRTPRQAADDPTRRGDLIKLLDTFPSGAGAGAGMDADRLREALGLE